MMTLERVLAKKDIGCLAKEVHHLLGRRCCVLSPQGRVLLHDGEVEALSAAAHPVSLDGEILGEVRGCEAAQGLASVLAHLVRIERDKKAILRDALEKYKEISLLYEVSEKFATNLDPQQVGRLVIDQALLLLRADFAGVFLCRSQGGLDLLAASGDDEASGVVSLRLAGVTSVFLESGKSEIVNDVATDVRYQPCCRGLCALMAASLKVKSAVIGAIVLGTAAPHTYTAEELQLLSSLAAQAAAAIENARLYERQQKLFFSTIAALAETIEMRDPYTGGHTRRVMEYSLAIGLEMGLADREMVNLRLAASLHDIGKIGIDDAVLRKPGSLSPSERLAIQKHSEYAFDILRHVEGLDEVVAGVRGHHERFDGRGYPDALNGLDIPLIARIIAVADAYDAMLSARPYRRALPASVCREELLRHQGTQFDPEVVDAFLRTAANESSAAQGEAECPKSS